MDFFFTETEIFTKKIKEFIGQNEYRLLQTELIKRPDLGNVIPGGKGIRKLRWSLQGKGKRGGIRVLYYFFRSEHEIYMLYVFKKSKQEDLTREQLSTLVGHVKSHLKGEETHL